MYEDCPTGIAKDSVIMDNKQKNKIEYIESEVIIIFNPRPNIVKPIHMIERVYNLAF
jgi:hypothetical protein